MRYLISISVITAGLVACTPPKPTSLKIGEATYLFPADASIDLQPNDVYVNFVVGRSVNGRATNSSIKMEFNEGYNRQPSEGAFPSVRWLTRTPAVRKLKVINRPWGTVVCNLDNVKYGSRFACGTTFIEAGAKWQVLFPHRRLQERTDIISEAREALNMIRVE